MAWVNGGDSAAAAAQFATNKTTAGLFDGVMAFCGTSFITLNDGTAQIALNSTEYAKCDAIRTAVKSQPGGEFHMCLGGVTPEAIAHPDTVITSAVSLALSHGWAGYNIDDESSCAPR